MIVITRHQSAQLSAELTRRKITPIDSHTHEIFVYETWLNVDDKDYRKIRQWQAEDDNVLWFSTPSFLKGQLCCAS